MKIIIAIFIVLFSASIGAEEKTTIYKAGAVLIVLDGITTSRGIHNGAREVGFPKYVIGEYPSDAKIAGWTAANLALWEWADHWPKPWREPFQNITVILRSGVVLWNYRVSIQ